MPHYFKFAVDFKGDALKGVVSKLYGSSHRT